MRSSWMAGVIAIAATFACVSLAAAQSASAHRPAGHHKQVNAKSHAMRTVGRGGARLGFAPGERGTWQGHGGAGYAALVGDPRSGLGFYPLPLKYRVGAWRYRMRTQRPPWANPIYSAVASDAARYNYGWTIPTPANDYHYGVFNPYDGVGTPFFAGYYGPAGNEDDDDHPLFGTPYPN